MEMQTGYGATTRSDRDRQRANATAATWWVAILGQAIGPVWLVFLGMLEQWSASYGPSGTSSAMMVWVSAGIVVSGAAWVLQLVLTGYRRRRGSRAVSGIVFLVLGGAWTVLLLVAAMGTPS